MCRILQILKNINDQPCGYRAEEEGKRMVLNLGGREINIGKHVITVMISFLLLIAALAGYFLMRVDSQVAVYSAEETAPVPDTGETSGSGTETGRYVAATPVPEQKVDRIKVYVVGCVNKPGVVTLAKGDIVEEAIKAAGGAASGADLDSINLAYELTENVMIRIAAKRSGTAARANPPGKLPASEEKSEIIHGSGGAVVDEKTETVKKDGKIDINTATAAELDALPGIGGSTAQKIISYREKNGKFKTAGDIMKVSGIGQSKYDGLKDFITVK